jgi:hypothetical protein
MRIAIPRSYKVVPVGTGSSIGGGKTGRPKPAYFRLVLPVSVPSVIFGFGSIVGGF